MDFLRRHFTYDVRYDGTREDSDYGLDLADRIEMLLPPEMREKHYEVPYAELSIPGEDA